MSVVDITDTLVDSAALAEMARRANVTVAQARAIAAMLGDLSDERRSRLCATAQADRIRQSQREARKHTTVGKGRVTK